MQEERELAADAHEGGHAAERVQGEGAGTGLDRRTATAKQFEIQCRLLARHVKRDYFVQHVDILNADQYRDVITERAIAGLCGFPLCPNYLPVAVARRPGQKYRISTREKRVYDVGERIRFCSDECLISAKLEEVHLPDHDENMPPIPRSVDGNSLSSSQEIAERTNVEPPSLEFNSSGLIEGYAPGKVIKRYSHPSQTKRITPPSFTAPSGVKSSHSLKSGSAGTTKQSRSGRTQEDWIKQGPAIYKGMLDKRPKVQVIPLDEAIALERKQQTVTPTLTNGSKKIEHEIEDDASETSSDDEDYMIRPEVTSLPLFAQLWNSLSGWPTPRSRAIIRGITDFKDVEVPSNRPPVEEEPEYENSEDDEEELYDTMPDQERARWRVIRSMLLRELPTVCVQLHISVPLHSQLCRLLEAFKYSKPISYKPHQLRLVLMVLLEVLSKSDPTLREQLAASEKEKHDTLVANGIDKDEWRLLVELFDEDEQGEGASSLSTEM